MKNIIKLIAIIFTFYSCNVNDDLDIKEENQNLENNKIPDVVSSPSGKSIIIDGKTYSSGFGYNPALGRPHSIAIDDYSLMESTDVGYPALNIKLESIETNEELRKFVQKESGRSANLILKLFGIGGSKTKQFEETYTFNKNHISVIAKINIRRFRNLTNGAPALRPEAQKLVDEKKFDEFLNRYGALYVDDNITGAQLYYVYNYNLENETRITKSSFKKAAKISIGKIFGIGGSGVLTQEETAIVESTQLRTGVVSDLIGYAPQLIKSPEDLNSEIVRVQEYLKNNPNLAGTIERTLKPYSGLFDSSFLQNEAKKQLQCHENLEKWEKVWDEILFIRNSTENDQLKNHATTVLETIQNRIHASKNCTGSVPPSDTQYQGIKRMWEEEKAMVNLYRYYSPSRTDHYYTTDFSKFGNGAHGWKYEGVQCKIFNAKIENTIPLYRYWSATLTDTYLTTDFSEHGNGNAVYVFDGIAGYVYPKEYSRTRPLYKLKYKNGGDTFYTCNKNEASNQYDLVGIVGYVL